MDGVVLQPEATVTGALNYMKPMAKRPVNYTYQPPEGTPWRSAENESRALPIRNGRLLAGRLSLDREGFELVQHASAVKDFYDSEELRSVYYPESERLVRAATGAARVLAFDHNIRSGSPQWREKHTLREPVTRVHNDYTIKSGPQRVRDLLPPDEAEELLRHRFAIVNLWRPIRAPLQDRPLAVCDAQSMRQEEFVGTDLVYRDRTGETYSVTWSPQHRWYYFPDMQRHEALLLKCYDSATDGRARFTAHSAFDDPTTPADALPRESIELRTLVFFPPKH